MCLSKFHKTARKHEERGGEGVSVRKPFGQEDRWHKT